MTTESPAIKDLPVMGFFFSAFLSFLFGANTIAIKISLTELGIFSTAAIRFSLGAVTILAWALATRQPIAIRKGQIHQLAILSVIFSVQLALFYYGLSKTYASRGTLLANMQPFFVLILAHIFIPGDRITGKKLTGMLLAFTGVAFVLLQRQGVSVELKTGDVIVLCAAFLWACNGVYTKKVLVDLQPYQVVLYPMLIASPLLFAGAWLTGESIPSSLDVDVILAVMYQAFVTASFGFVAWNTMLKKYGAVAMHSFIFIMPVAGVLLGNRMLGEPITANLIVALLLIVTGIVIVNVRTRKDVVIVHPGRNV